MRLIAKTNILSGYEWELVKVKKPCKSCLFYLCGENRLLPEIVIESIEETML